MPYNSWFNDFCLSFRVDSNLHESEDFARFPTPSQHPEQGQQGRVLSTYPLTQCLRGGVLPSNLIGRPSLVGFEWGFPASPLSLLILRSYRLGELLGKKHTFSLGN